MKWPRKRLSDLGIVSTGSTPRTSEPRFYGGTLPFVTPAELDTGIPITTTPRTLTDEGASEARVLPEGAVMVCCIGSLGKTGIAGRSVATNQQINSVVFDPKQVWPGYGFYACRLLKPKLDCMAPATTLPIVSKSKFAALTIPIPPLAEQRRIAEVLDRAEALRVKRRAALAQLDPLTQSLFLEIFGDPATNPKGWPKHKLGEVADKITDGEHQTPQRTTHGIKLLSARNIRDGFIDVADVDYVSPEEHARIKRRCNPERGDVLISCSGTIGRVATVSTSEPFSLVRSVALIKPKRELIDSTYLEYYLRTPAIHSRMQRSANASSQANLFQGQIRELPTTLPPPLLQREFARKVRGVEKLRTAQHTSLAELDALFASLQHRAFRGEL